MLNRLHTTAACLAALLIVASFVAYGALALRSSPSQPAPAPAATERMVHVCNNFGGCSTGRELYVHPTGIVEAR